MRIFLILILSFFIAQCFLLTWILPLVIIGFGLYLWFLVKSPEIGLFMAFLVIIDCFSMLSENLMWLPTLYRIRDIFFITSFIPLFIGLSQNDKRIKEVFGGPLAKCIYAIIVLTIAQMFITKIRFNDESFNSIIRIGRKYLYYAMYFPAVFVLLDEARLKRFVKLFVITTAVFCLLYISQFFVGPSHRIFVWGRVEWQNLQGFNVTRMYIPGVLFATLLFHVCFAIFLFNNKIKSKFLNSLLMSIAGIQTLLTFGRAHIFGVVTGSLFSSLFSKGLNKKKALLKVSLIGVFIVFGIFIYSLFHSYYKKTNFFQAVSARIYSTYEAISKKQDTFGFRLRDSAGRIELIKNNPLLGVGFVHDESRLFSMERGFNRAIRTTDSGIITLLLDFGLLGAGWLFFVSFVFLKSARKVLKSSSNELHRSIMLGILAFYFGRVFSFITLADFVTYDGIIAIVLAFVFTKVLNCNSKFAYGFINNHSQL